jgi:hypothetical protein
MPAGAHMTWQRLGRLAGFVAIAGVLGFLVHEAGHWAGGRLWGLDMYLQLNKAGPADPDANPGFWAQITMTSGGPVVTLVQALIGVVLARRFPLPGFALVFTAAFMRILAFAISILVNPNDEARIGEMLGLGPYPVHLAVIGILLALLAVTAMRTRAGWRAFLTAFVMSSVAVTAVVYLDPVVGRIL